MLQFNSINIQISFLHQNTDRIFCSFHHLQFVLVHFRFCCQLFIPQLLFNFAFNRPEYSSLLWGSSTTARIIYLDSIVESKFEEHIDWESVSKYIYSNEVKECASFH